MPAGPPLMRWSILAIHVKVVVLQRRRRGKVLPFARNSSPPGRGPTVGSGLDCFFPDFPPMPADAGSCGEAVEDATPGVGGLVTLAGGRPCEATQRAGNPRNAKPYFYAGAPSRCRTTSR